LKVDLSEEAEAHVLAIDAWWRENRRAVADLFADELEQVLKTLEETPTLGTVYRARTAATRRVLLRRTHYHVYFVEEAERLYVLAVWSAFRGSGPTL
jgi:plasmid stabilization system protein ParE